MRFVRTWIIRVLSIDYHGLPRTVAPNHATVNALNYQSTESFNFSNVYVSFNFSNVYVSFDLRYFIKCNIEFNQISMPTIRYSTTSK